MDWGAEIKRGKDGRRLLKIKITAEVDDVRSEYTITFGRYDRNAAVGHAAARADASGDMKPDAERSAAVIKALTGRGPKVYRMKDGRIMIICYEGHLEGFTRFVELAETIMKWLEETSRR